MLTDNDIQLYMEEIDETNHIECDLDNLEPFIEKAFEDQLKLESFVNTFGDEAQKRKYIIGYAA